MSYATTCPANDHRDEPRHELSQTRRRLHRVFDGARHLSALTRTEWQPTEARRNGSSDSRDHTVRCEKTYTQQDQRTSWEKYERIHQLADEDTRVNCKEMS